MTFLSLLLLSTGLAMDATAASFACGAFCKKNKTMMLKIALLFGLFQGIMPLIGYAAGFQMKDYIVSYDHWIAFFLLLFVGTRMMFEKEKQKFNLLSRKNLFMLAIATSIDALVVGISFSLIKSNIILSAIVIALVTLFLSFTGGMIGKSINIKPSYLKIFGGTAIVLIGLKILLSHLY